MAFLYRVPSTFVALTLGDQFASPRTFACCFLELALHLLGRSGNTIFVACY